MGEIYHCALPSQFNYLDPQRGVIDMCGHRCDLIYRCNAFLKLIKCLAIEVSKVNFDDIKHLIAKLEEMRKNIESPTRCPYINGEKALNLLKKINNTSVPT